MDPDKLVMELLETAYRVLRQNDDHNEPDPTGGDAQDLAEMITNLDEWISKGGFLPSKWSDRCPEALVHYSKNCIHSVFLFPRNALNKEKMTQAQDLASHYMQEVETVDPIQARNLKDILSGIRTMNGNEEE